VTYGELKSLTRGLLTGDVTLTTKEDELTMMLAYSYNKIATEADALKLFTANKNDSILRQGPGNLFVRKPNMPSLDDDELDIDDELGYPAARYIANFVSREKGGIHVMEAGKLISHYNQKVQAYMEALEQDDKLES